MTPAGTFDILYSMFDKCCFKPVTVLPAEYFFTLLHLRILLFTCFFLQHMLNKIWSGLSIWYMMKITASLMFHKLWNFSVFGTVYSKTYASVTREENNDTGTFTNVSNFCIIHYMFPNSVQICAVWRHSRIIVQYSKLKDWLRKNSSVNKRVQYVLQF